jgi:osmotically-inducible protein OsmY
MIGRCGVMVLKSTSQAVVGALVMVGILWIPEMIAGQGHEFMNDEEIKHRVEHELTETEAAGRNVRVMVSKRVVTLTGTVPSLWAKNEILDEIRDIDDVESVVSELTVAGAESDRVIAEEVARSVRQYVFYSIYDDVNVTVNNGVVTLTGRTTSPHHANELADVASRVRGVREVRNEIASLPVSIHDDQLRYSIASQIYRDPLFWKYGIQVDPPIHVIVENGRVTLTGVVNSEVERRKAEHIARSTFGAFSVENKLRVE